MPPLTIFLDTNVFICGSDKAKNPKLEDFNEAPLKTLRELFKEKGIRLLVPEMFELEMARKIEKGAARIYDKLKNLAIDFKDTPSYIPTQFHNTEFNKVDHVAIGQKITSEWVNFKNDFTVEKLDLVSDLNKVIQQYLQVELPFSNEKGKQKEFPDAFMVNVIEDYQVNKKGNIAIITSDKDFGNYFRRKKYFKVYSTLKDYLKAFQPDEDSSEKVKIDVSDITVPTTTEDIEELKGVY